MIGRVLSGSLAVILAALLLAVALQEVFGPAPNVVFSLIAAHSGLGSVEPAGRYCVAGLQLLAVALVLWPPSRAPGAGLGAILGAGAAAAHLTPWLGVVLPDAEPAAAALASGATPDQIARMALPGDGGQMFMVALATLVLSLAVIGLERVRGRRVRGRPARPPAGAALTRG